MSGDVSQMPQSAIEAAREKLAARNEEARQRGVKQGRLLERKDIYNEFGAQTLEDLRVLNRITAEIDQRWQREERKEAKGAFWRGIAFGAAGGAILASGGFLLLVDRAMQSAFDRAGEFAQQATMSGAAVAAQAQRDAAPNYPRTDERQP